MADTNRNQWEERTGWQQGRDSRNQVHRSRDDYSSNYGYDQRDSGYRGEDYRSGAPYRSDRGRMDERRDDYSDLDRNRNRSTNMGSGYDPYNYGQTVGSFNQGKEGSYSSRFDYDSYRNRDRYDNRDTGYDSDYNRSYGRREADTYGTGSYYGNTYRDRYERSDEVSDRDRRNTEDRYRNITGNRDWWDRTTDEVASWFGDDDAQRRRERDRAMGPHRGKGPKGYTRSDERIKDDVNDRLSDDSFIDASDIDVTVEHCEVVLSGTVDSKEEKRRAEDIAERISGVKNVENRLKVKNRENRSDGATIYRDNRY